MSQIAASVIVIASMVVLLRLLVSSVVAYGTLPELVPVSQAAFLFGLIVALYQAGAR